MGAHFNGRGPFTASVERLDGVPVVKMYGELDLSTVPQVEEACSEAAALREGVPCVILDLSGITFMDSTGVGALIGQRVTLGTGGLWLVLGDGGAERTMRLVGLGDSFHVSPDLETALRETRGDPESREATRD